MATAGPNNSGTVANRANGRGGLAWLNPTNAQGAQNGTNATNTGDGINAQDFLDCTNMGWAGIPGSAVVSNLLVEAFCVGSAVGNKLTVNINDTAHTLIASSLAVVPTVAAWTTIYNADPPAGYDSVFAGGTDEYEFIVANTVNTVSIDAIRVTVTYTGGQVSRLLLMGVG